MDPISLSISRHALPIAEVMPGALLWPRFLDLRMTGLTELSMQGPMAVLIALIALLAFSTH